MKKTIFAIIILLVSILAIGQSKMQQAYKQIPIVYSNIVPDSTGTLYFYDAKLSNAEPFYILLDIFPE